MRRAALSWLFAPVHLAALATGAKSFRDNPIIGSPTLNRAGLHVARMRLASRMAQARRQRLAPLISGADRAAFERDGFVVKRDFLPEAVFDVVKREALTFAAPTREQPQGDAITRRIALDHRALSRLPAVRAMLEGGEWLGLVRYVGSSLLHPQVYIQTIFAHARVAPPDPQTRLHADTFHPTIKAWFFLTDIADDEGFAEPNLWTGIGRGRQGAGAAIVGDPDQVLAKLQAYADLGMEAFILSGCPHAAECDLFARHVLPQLDHGRLFPRALGP